MKDYNLVNEDILENSGAVGVIHRGNGVQAIYGPRATVIKSDLEDYLDDDENSKEKKKGRFHT